MTILFDPETSRKWRREAREREERAREWVKLITKALGPITRIHFGSFSLAVASSPEYAVRKFRRYLYRYISEHNAYRLKVIIFLDRTGASGRLHIHAFIYGARGADLEAGWDAGTAAVSRMRASHARYVSEKDGAPVCDDLGAPTGQQMGDRATDGFHFEIITAGSLIRERILSKLDDEPALSHLGLHLSLEQDIRNEWGYVDRVVRPRTDIIAKNLRRLCSTGRIYRCALDPSQQPALSRNCNC